MTSSNGLKSVVSNDEKHIRWRVKNDKTLLGYECFNCCKPVDKKLVNPKHKTCPHCGTYGTLYARVRRLLEE
jgi:hypothetical protein